MEGHLYELIFNGFVKTLNLCRYFDLKQDLIRRKRNFERKRDLKLTRTIVFKIAME